MAKTVTTSIQNGQITTTTDIDGVRSVTTVPALAHTVQSVQVAKVSYKNHKVWNPTTSAFITVNCTGNEAQDAALLAAAFWTAGVRTNSIISSTV